MATKMAEMKVIVVIVATVVAVVIFFSSVDSDKSNASFTTSAVVLFKGESIWVPTRVKRPRHQRFVSKPRRSVPSVETLSREVSGTVCPPSADFSRCGT